MGHPLFDNMRQGNWLLDYTVTRLKETHLKEFADYVSQRFELVKQVPLNLKPKYATKVFLEVYEIVVKSLLEKMKPLKYKEDPFIRNLALACVQMYGRVPSAKFRQYEETICAGLPHFSTEWMRCWGRDTFISLKGLLLVTG